MGKHPRILIVDDDEACLKWTGRLVESFGYETAVTTSGRDAYNLIHETGFQPDVILVDLLMPGWSGLEMLQVLKTEKATAMTPVVIVTGQDAAADRVKALSAGADDIIGKPYAPEELHARLKSLLVVKAYHDEMIERQTLLEQEVERRTQELRKAQERVKLASAETIYRLARMAEYRDEDTGMHICRVSHYAAALARELGWDDQSVANLLFATPMHDVGKVAIPDQILLKPGKLTPEERSVMQRHTVIGADILASSKMGSIQMAAAIARSHHERWDGKGYPDNYAGDEIPEAARIVSVADVFDALTSRRPYKEPFSFERSIEIIRADRGIAFGPSEVDGFLRILDEIALIGEAYKDEEIVPARAALAKT